MGKRKPIPNVRIIDNKKVWLTPDEFRYYEEICKGYDRPNFNGKDLFQDHFEVNDDGVITFVKPPHKKYSSMEVYTFLISLQVNQILRIIQEQIASLIREADEKFKEKVAEMNTAMEQMKSLIEEVERLKEEGSKPDSNKGCKTDDGRTNSGTEGSGS